MNESQYLILIGKNISRIRKAQGLTIKELGYRCDIEKTNLIPHSEYLKMDRSMLLATLAYMKDKAKQIEQHSRTKRR